MIDSRVQTDFVHHHDTRLFGCSVQFPHGRAHVACGDNVRLALNSRLDDSSMVGVRNKGDDHIMGYNSGIERCLAADIKGYAGTSRKISGKVLCGLKCTASWQRSGVRCSKTKEAEYTYCQFINWVAYDVVHCGLSNVSAAEEQDLL